MIYKKRIIKYKYVVEIIIYYYDGWKKIVLGVTGFSILGLDAVLIHWRCSFCYKLTGDTIQALNH